jgi:hypothetical protein
MYNFYQEKIDVENPFDMLANPKYYSINPYGRKVGIVVDMQNDIIPIIRTTTIYPSPPLKFDSIHFEIINKIQNLCPFAKLHFNNAMMEIYTNNYKTMSYHTDQALDLQEKSYICIFSCYKNPNAKNIRKLYVKNKITNESCEYNFYNNSFLLFSTETNKNHVHKIILNNTSDNSEWIGITFRLSKTFIKFDEKNIPRFLNNQILRIANEEEIQQFRQYKNLENITVDFIYPEIDFSISPSDLMKI